MKGGFYVKEKLLVYAMILLVLLGICGSVSADGVIDSEIIDFNSSINPYQDIPTNIYPFIFSDNADIAIDIDISTCIEGRLYVYDLMANTLAEISDKYVTSFKGTNDSIYYVTQDQAVYVSDYAGDNSELLYQGTGEVITNLNYYLDSVYFIENQQTVIFLDTETATAETILSVENLYWVFRSSNTDLLIETESGYYLYDLTTQTIQEHLSEVAVTALMNQAFAAYSDLDVDNVSVMSTYSGSVT